MGRKPKPPVMADGYTTPSQMLFSALQINGMSQVQLALECNVSKKHINDIARGYVRITPEMAVKFEKITGVDARLWNEAQLLYDEHGVKINGKKMKNIRKTTPFEVNYRYDKKRVECIRLQLFYRTIFRAQEIARNRYMISVIPITHDSHGRVVKSVDEVHKHMISYVKWLGAYLTVELMAVVRSYEDGKINYPVDDNCADQPRSNSDSDV